MSRPFSLVVCVYNPEERIFARVLDALRTIAGSDSVADVVVVDNNSDPPLAKREYVKVRTDGSNIRVVVETEQGLTPARIRGYSETTGDWVVMVDDDGVIDPDYLTELARLAAANPQVSIWGPGTVTVEYLDPTPSAIRQHCGAFLLEKSIRHVTFGCAPGVSAFNPPGLGMSVRRATFARYVGYVRTGRLTASDRKGASLASAGDSQICFAAMLAGEATGLSPGLRMRHLIPGRRTTRKYLTSLVFNVSRSLEHARHEAWPDLYPTPFCDSGGPLRALADGALATGFAVLTLQPAAIPMYWAPYFGSQLAVYAIQNRPAPGWFRTLCYWVTGHRVGPGSP